MAIEKEKTKVDHGHDDDEDDVDEQLDNKFLTFQLDKEVYAVNILHVTEIIELLKVTPMPEADPCMKGVINLRGKVIPVMSIRLRFEMKEVDYTAKTCIVVVRVGEIEMGIIVDSVCEVLDIDDSNITEPPTLRENSDKRFVKGMGKDKENVIIILDLDKVILSKTEFAQ